MLILSRKENESIIINENIKIVVTKIRGGRVRLGIEAPKDVAIRRQELHSKLEWYTTPEALPADLVASYC